MQYDRVPQVLRYRTRLLTGVVDDCDEKNWDSLACRQLALAASTSTDPDNNYGSMGVCGASDGKTSIADACPPIKKKTSWTSGTATTLAPMAWSTYWTNADGQTIDDVAGG